MAEQPGDFTIRGAIRDVQVIARGQGVRIRGYLQKQYGGANWRKLKGVCLIEDDHGWIGNAEIHWFEAHGIGRVKWKIKARLGDG
jgi:hypothetical protein